MTTMSQRSGPNSDPYRDPASPEFGFRQARFRNVRALIEAALSESDYVRIIDLGGTEQYWAIAADFLDANRGRIHIVLVNSVPVTVRDTELFSSITGDATSPDLLLGQEFDLAHSNSVIEHVGYWPDMQRFAENTRRLGRRYYMQTPNYWFPLEPHFRFPGFQYLPEAIRIAMLRRLPLGFFKPLPDYEEARDVIEHHRLIAMGKVRKFFPDADYSYEWVYGMPKSIMAIRSDPPARRRTDAPSMQPELAPGRKQSLANVS